MQAALARPSKRVSARFQACIGYKILTSGIGSAPKHYWAVLVLLGSKNVVEADGEAVEVANVQRAKIMVECIVEQRVVHGEVAGRICVSCRSRRDVASAVTSPSRRLGRGNKNGVGVGGVDVSCQVKAVWNED